MISDNIPETIKSVQEIQDVIEDVIDEIKEIVQEIKNIENVEDVIDVIEHVSQDVEIVVQKVKIEKKNDDSIFKCIFDWIESFF